MEYQLTPPDYTYKQVALITREIRRVSTKTAYITYRNDVGQTTFRQDQVLDSEEELMMQQGTSYFVIRRHNGTFVCTLY